MRLDEAIFCVRSNVKGSAHNKLECEASYQEDNEVDEERTDGFHCRAHSTHKLSMVLAPW